MTQQQTPQKEQPRYPIMTIQIAPGGILLTIVRSVFDTQNIMIPSDNADTMCAEWLATRPTEIKSQLIKQLTGIELARGSKHAKAVN